MPRPTKARKSFGDLLTIPGSTTSDMATQRIVAGNVASYSSSSMSSSAPRDQVSKIVNSSMSNGQNVQTASSATLASDTEPSCTRQHQRQSPNLTTSVNNIDPSDNDDLCLICAESVKCYALGACSHRTCHICSIRMRALYKKRDCAFCKTELPEVIFTTDAQASFSSYSQSALQFKDPHLSILCETFEQLDELLTYLKFNCPHPDCSSVLNNWKDLKFHTRSSHGLVLCDLCCLNKKVFAHEHTLFTHKGLTVHLNQGSVGTGRGLRPSTSSKDRQNDHEAQQDGFTGHPRCDFCATHFYDDDQLYQHCRDKHEQCFICIRNGVDRWRYYLDYNHLETHFRHSHYLCTQSLCLEARFMVYETALDYQAHQIEAHGAELGIRAIKDARKLETNFNYSGSDEPLSQTNDRSDRERRAGRGIAVMDIAPVRMEESSILSNANRIVPGLGPNPEQNNSRKHDKGKSKPASTKERDDAPLQSTSRDLNILSSRKITSPVELQRHALLLQRVSEAVQGVEAKITSFKLAVRMYRNNEMAASDFLDNICNIFEHRSETIGSILSHLLDLLDVEDERKEHLLEKWLDLKITQSQYPSLDANTGSSGLDTAGLTLLSSSSWVSQKPKYSKLLGTSKKNTNQEPPGLVDKTRNGAGQHATAWSRGSSSQSVMPDRHLNSGRLTKPSMNSTRNRSQPNGTNPSSSVTSSSRTTDAHFPSLPSKPTRSAKDSVTNGNGMMKATSWCQMPPAHSLAQSNVPSTSSNNNPPPPTVGKKSKKQVLFTTIR